MRRLVRRLIAAAGAVVGLYLLASLVLPLVPGPGSAEPPGEGLRLGLIAGPIHYDFIVPLTPEVRARLGYAAAAGVGVDDPGAEWLVLGHGGRRFYTTVGTYADVNAAAVLWGVIGDRTVVRMDAVGPVREDVGIRWLEVGPEGLDRLMTAMEAGLVRDASGRPVVLAVPGFSATDVFFEGQGRADIFQTCNAWVGEMLRAAGYRFGMWTPATWSVWVALKRFGVEAAE